MKWTEWIQNLTYRPVNCSGDCPATACYTVLLVLLQNTIETNTTDQLWLERQGARGATGCITEETNIAACCCLSPVHMCEG